MNEQVAVDSTPAQPAGAHRPLSDRPGALRSTASLTLQTRQAQRLIVGRKRDDEKHAIIGLTRFAVLLRQVYVGARADDPYADWCLVQVHEALERSQEELRGIRKDMDRMLGQVPALDIAVAHSVEPIQIPLEFKHPYAFRGAYLVADFDDVARAILTARHVGLMTRNASEHLLAQASRAVKRVFSNPLRYRFLGITREDVAQNTARAQQARELMGELPEAILAGEKRAAFGPDIQGGFRGLNAGVGRVAAEPTVSPEEPTDDADPDTGVPPVP